MKKRKLLHNWIPGFMVFLLIVAGCGQSQNESTMIRQARLVGNENLQLKKQIADKDNQIANLTAQAKQLQDQNHKLTEQYNEIKNNQDAIIAKKEEELDKQYADTYKNLMNIILKCEGKLEKYEQAGQEAEKK